MENIMEQLAVYKSTIEWCESTGHSVWEYFQPNFIFTGNRGTGAGSLCLLGYHWLEWGRIMSLLRAVCACGWQRTLP